MDSYQQYGGTPPHVAGSETSRAAAEAIEASTTELQQIVFKLLQAAATTSDIGMTDDELAVASGLIGNTQRPRRIELVELGLVCASGLKRKTRTGSGAGVWRVCLGLECSCKKVPSDPQPEVPATPSRAEVTALLALFREVRAERKSAGRTFPPEAAVVCRWLGFEYGIPPEP
jgi:hypothetical protein